MSAPESCASYSSQQAWRNIAKTNAHARWDGAPGDPRWDLCATKRLTDPIFVPALRPSFRIEHSDRVFCMGSCFARHVEKSFSQLGFEVLSCLIDVPISDAMNKYNTFSMLNELRWALDPGAHPFPEESLIQESGGTIDPHLSFGSSPRATALAQRQRVIEGVRRISECQLVVFTLGLVEAWHDNKTGVYLTEAPSFGACRRDPARYEMRITSYAANLAALEEIHALLVRFGHPNLRIVVTVSPVPFLATFTEDDVVVANTYSKSTLRAAAADFARRHANVDYLPSFESVMNSRRDLTWEPDLIHVQGQIVQANTLNFLTNYLAGDEAKQLGRELEQLLGGVGQTGASEQRELPQPPEFEMAAEDVESYPAGTPTVTASSSMTEALGPANLAEGAPVPWHAASPPRYPQELHFQYPQPLRPQALWLQAQSRFPDRAPTAFALYGGGNHAWEQLLAVPAARWQHGGEWQHWALAAERAYTDFRLMIHASGNPTFLTLQRFWLAPQRQ